MSVGSLAVMKVDGQLHSTCYIRTHIGSVKAGLCWFLWHSHLAKVKVGVMKH